MNDRKLKYDLAFANYPIRRTVRGFLLIVLPLLALITLAPRFQATMAGETKVRNGSDTILYRRIFVPADRVEVWPRNGEKYLPVEAREFEAWIKRSNAELAGESARARIDLAEYTAQFDHSGVLSGHGRWTISAPRSDSSFLPLGRTSLLFRDPRWTRSPQQAVRLGAWGRNGGSVDRYGLEVHGSDVLEFDWRMIAKPNADGAELTCELPPANSSKLILDLPNGMQPAIPSGIILGSRPLPSDSSENAPTHHRWELLLGADSATTLRLLNFDTRNREKRSSIRLRDDVSYLVTQRGLEIIARWHLHGSEGLPRELALSMPEGTQLLSIESDGHNLPWQVVREAREPSNARIDLAKHVKSRSLEITVTAWHPVVLDQPWTLPTLRPDGVFWTAGDISFSVDPKLELQELLPIEAAQTKVQLHEERNNRSEIHSFSAYGRAATLCATFARRLPQPAVRLGTSLSLADPDLNGRLVANWSVDNGSVHRLSGRIATGWTVEAIETVPTDALGEWFVDERRGDKHLEIQLTRALTSNSPISVKLTGRLQHFGLNKLIPTDTLRLVHWDNASVQQQLLTIQTIEPFAAESVGELPTLSDDKLNQDARMLLDEPATTSPVYDLVKAGNAAGVQLSLKRGQYQADITIEGTFGDEVLQQEYSLEIQPQSTAIDQVTIYVTAPIGEKLQWTDESGGALSAERLPNQSVSGTSSPLGGEYWVIRLPQPTARAIRIHAGLTAAWPAKQLLPLLSAPEADKQLGRVRIRSEFSATPTIEPNNVQSLPLPPIGDNDIAGPHVPLRASFQYDAANCGKAIDAPELWIGPCVASGTSTLIADYVTIESFVSADGAAVHRATYRLKNHGAKRLLLQLPGETTLNAVTIDGQVVSFPVRPSDDRLLVDLPTIAQPILTINFQTYEEPLSNGRQLAPPLIQAEIPLLGGEWIIWLPEEFAISRDDNEDSPKASWRQRLFGPLARAGEASPFNPLRSDDWTQFAGKLSTWWQGTQTTSDEPSFPNNGTAPIGWRACRVAFIAERPPVVVVLRSSTSAGAAAALLLLGALCGRWIRMKRRNVFVALLIASAALALILPANITPITAGAFLGLLISLVVQWPAKTKDIDESYQRWTRTTVASASLVLTLTIMSVRLVLAQEVLPDNHRGPTPPAQAIQTVLIPVNADGRQAGSKYYVNERFLRDLLRAADEKASPAGDWLMSGASYAGELRPNTDRTGVVAGEWTLSFDIETFQRETTIDLPLVRNEAAWKETAMLDGVPVPITWRNDGHRCALEVAEPGRYSLTITCVPHIAEAGGKRHLALTVPPLVVSRVQIRRPSELRGVRILGAAHVEPPSSSDNVVAADLPPINVLSVEWDQSNAIDGGAASAQLMEMDWLTITPAQVELQTMFVAEGGAALPATIAIRADVGWELVSPSNREIRIEHEEDGRLQVLLPAAESDRRNLFLQWRHVNAPPFGRMHVPNNKVISASIARRWMAISADPSLDCQVSGGPDTTAELKEFLALWGSDESRADPRHVLAGLTSDSDIELSIKPTKTESEVDEVLHLAIDSDRLHVVDELDVTPGTSHDFQFAFHIPALLSIEQVSLTQGNQSVPVRWSRASGERLNVFYSKQVADKYRLTLRGEMPYNAPGPVELPRVFAADVKGAVQRLQLYHNEDVKVSVSGLTENDAPPTESPTRTPAGWNFRKVGEMRLSKPDEELTTLTVTRNELELVGKSLITLSRETDSWWAALQCRFDVKNGDLGTLRVRVPTTWIGPFEIDSNHPATINVVSADEQTAVLAVRFAELIATGGRLDLNIRGPVAVSLLAPVAVPQISIDRQPNIQLFARVPNSLESQPVAWTQIGVRPAALPQELQTADRRQESWSSFAIIENPFRLAFQPQASSRPAPLIRLSDTTIISTPVGDNLMLTRLIVASHGLADCALNVPAAQELVAVNLDGQPALILPIGPEHWRLTLGPTQLPQFVEIVSRSASNLPAKPGHIRRPSLWSAGEQLPVEMSLWSIAQPANSSRHQIKATSTVTANELAALRLDRMVSIAESAAPFAAELAIPDNLNWFRCWTNLLLTAKSTVPGSIAQTTQVPPDSQVSRIADEQIQRATEHLNQWLAKTEKFQQNRGERPQTGVLEHRTSLLSVPALSRNTRDWTYYVTAAGSDRSPAIADAVGEPIHQSAAPLLVLLALAGGSVWLTYSPTARDFVCRWPGAVGVLVGLAYWAWLWPSWLGLMIAAACVITSLRSSWPGRSTRTEASTVLRAASRS
jgi:hypothetical protein